MGDSTTVRIQMPKTHAPAFFKIALAMKKEPTIEDILKETEYEDEDWDKSTWLDLSFTEINYAWSDEMRKAAMSGCVFVGDHGYGNEYGPHVFYSNGKSCEEWLTSYPEGDTYCIRVEPDGSVNYAEIANLQDFVAKLNAWRKKITEDGYDDPPKVTRAKKE